MHERQRQAEHAAEKRIHDQIADFRNGRSDCIAIGNEGGNAEMVAFLKAKGEMAATTRYKLQIWHGHPPRASIAD